MNDHQLEGSFNQFLESEEGLRVLDRSQADPLAALLREYSVVIDDEWDLSDFLEDKPGWCVMTAEEIALGREGTRTMFGKYEDWHRRWWQRKLAERPRKPSLLPPVPPPLRSPAGRMRRPR